MNTIGLCAQPGREAIQVPHEAFDLFVDLDVRGFAFASPKPEQLRLSRKDGARAPELTEAEREAIRRWKAHLLALVAYCHEEP